MDNKPPQDVQKRKPRELTEDSHGFLQVSFFYEGKTYWRTSGIHKDDKSPGSKERRREAELKQANVNALVAQIKLGVVPIPEGVTVPDFVFDRKLKPDAVADAQSKGLQTLINEFLALRRPPEIAKSTATTEKVHCGHLRRFIEHEGKLDVRLANLSPRFFEGYKLWRHDDEETGKNTINKELKTFKLLFTKAIDWKYTTENPLEGVKLYKKAGAPRDFMTRDQILSEIRKRQYTPEQAAELWEARWLPLEELAELLKLVKGKDPELFPLVAFAVYTGARRGEIARLRWDNVDADFAKEKPTGAEQATIISRKGSTTQEDTARKVPIHPDLFAVLKEQFVKTQREQEVFHGWSRDMLSRRLKDLVDGTDFEGIGWHTMRHSAASNWHAMEFPDGDIDAWLGHVTDDMRKRYRHFRPQRHGELMARMKIGAV